MTLHKEYDPFDDFPTAGPVVAPTAPDGSHDDIALGAPAPEAIQNRVVAEETMALFELEDAPTAPIDTAAVKALGEQKDAEAAAKKAEAEETDAEAPVTLATLAAEKKAEDATVDRFAGIGTMERPTFKTSRKMRDSLPAKETAGSDDDSIELTEAVMAKDLANAKKTWRNRLIGVGLVVLAGVGYRAVTAGTDTPEETGSNTPAPTAQAFPSSSASAEMSVDLGNNTAVVNTPTAEVTEQPTTATLAPGEVLIAPELQKYLVDYDAITSNPEAYLETYADELIHPVPVSEEELQQYYDQRLSGYDSANPEAAKQWVQDFVDEKLKENYSAVFNALYVNQGLLPELQQLMAEKLLKDTLQTSNMQDVADLAQIIMSRAVVNTSMGGHYEARFETGAASNAAEYNTSLPIFLNMDFYDAEGNFVPRANGSKSPTVSFSTEFGLVPTPSNTAALSSFQGEIKALN